MRDLRALNNCEVFKQIRAELSNYHNNKKRLNSFNYFSGNEQEIRYVASCVLQVLLEHELVEKKAQPLDSDSDAESDNESDKEQQVMPRAGADLDQLRGTLMYLLLNSQLGTEECQLELASCNPQCVHLLKQLPEPLPQLLTVSIALICGLETLFFEFLGSGPCWLTSQYIDCLNNVLGHLVPDKLDVLPFLGATLKSVTDAICQQSSPVNVMTNALTLLQRHLLRNEESLRQFLQKSRQRHNYLGLAVCQLIDALLHTMGALEKLPPPPVYGPIYILHSPLKESAQAVQPPELLRNYASKLLDILQLLLQQVSVDAYMNWLDLPSGQLLLHLQAFVCNQSQALHQMLAKDELLSTHSIFGQLSHFVTGAQTFEQCLETLTLGKLLSLLDGDLGPATEQQLLAAINELLHHRSICFGSEECVESLAQHIQLLTVEHAEIMLEHLAEAMQVKEEQADENDDDNNDDDENDVNAPYDELLRLALLPIFQQRCNIQEQIHLLHKRDELQLLQRFSFAGEDHNSRRISFFNRLTYYIERFPWPEFLLLCYEDPEKTWVSLAQLAMKHRGYSALYWHIAARCVPHAINYMSSTVQFLLQDEEILVTPNINLRLLLRLYELPLLLNGIKYGDVIVKRSRGHRPIAVRKRMLNLDVNQVPYNVDELQSVQANYLSSLARGLARHTAARNNQAVIRLLQILLLLPSIENQVMRCTRKSLQEKRQQLERMERKKEQANEQHDQQAQLKEQENIQKLRQQLQLAKSYVCMHENLSIWRVHHWELISQLILGMDQMRDTIQNYQAQRRSVIDMFVEYYVKYVSMVIFGNLGLQTKLKQIIDSRVQHKHLWQDTKLATLEEHPKRSDDEYAMLLGQASNVEAIHLLRLTIRQQMDIAVMEKLAKQVKQAGTPNAHQYYGFIFKCYMRALHKELIKGAKVNQYPCLIERILRTPGLRIYENLLTAMPNLKILLSPEGITNSTMIFQYVSRCLADR